MKNLGLIGIGRWGKILEPKLRAFGDLKFAVSGREFSEYEGRLKGVDWVFVATPTQTHEGVVRRCIDGGVNVFCEKPLTGEKSISEDLSRLADERGVLLYVDDVYLWRTETGRILRDNPDPELVRSMGFVEKKWGTFGDNIFNALTYHDLCIALKVLGIHDLRDLVFNNNRENVKDFQFRYGPATINFSYDRLYNPKGGGKIKLVSVNGRDYDFSRPSNDALKELIQAVLSGTADFEANRRRTLKIDGIIEMLSKI